MQKKLLLLLMLGFFTSLSLIAQPYVYTFNGDFTGTGADLSEVLETNGACSFSPAPAGSFSSQVINNPCGAPTRIAFNFNQGGGVSFDNTGALIGLDYTAHVVFTFNNPTTLVAQRIIDFSDRTRDNGAYVGGGQNLQLGGVGTTLGNPYTFTPGTFAMVTLVRDNTNLVVNTYINGQPYSVIDISAGFDPYIPGSAINLFLDDNSGPCDEGDGVVSYFSLNPVVSDDAQVLNDWNTICATILPLHLLDFAADKQNNSVVLKWTTETEVNTSHFEVERSADGRSFSKLTNVPANNYSTRNNYSYLDAQPLTGTGFYRIKIVDIDGRTSYSGILKISFNGKQQFQVYPNPVTDIMTISGIKSNVFVKLLNMEGKELLQKRSAGESMTMDISKYPSGMYILQYFDGEKTQMQKLIKK